MRHEIHSVRSLLACGLAIAANAVLAAPGTPAGERAVAEGPTTVRFSFMNTADRYEPVRFEIEQTINGVRAAPGVESGLSSKVPVSGTGDGWTAHRHVLVTDLIPETEYCFRAWSRDEDDDRSEEPSAWACARTPSHPPLAPLDVKVQLASDLDRTPGISWNTPDQSGHRGIMKFVVERQSPPGPNRPWILETEVDGPAGEQTASTRLAFAIEGSQIDPYAKHVYRVCAENSGGRACAGTVELTPPRTLVQPARPSVLDKPQLEAAPPASTQAVTAAYAASRTRERLGAQSKYRMPSSQGLEGTASPESRVEATAEVSEASAARGSMSVINEATPSASQPSTEPTSQSVPAPRAELPVQSGADQGVPVAEATVAEAEITEGSRMHGQVNDRARPKNMPPAQESESVANSKVDPSGPVELNPQPLPPKAAEQAMRTRASGTNTQQHQSSVDPSAKVTLNPQPLPPKTTVLKPRETTILPSGPMQTRDATTRYANPQTQIKGTAMTGRVQGQAQQEAKEIKTEEILCRGGKAFNLGTLDLGPAAESSFGTVGNKRAAGGGPTVIMQLNFGLARNERGVPVPAGENGEGLTRDSTCSFVNRGLQWDESPGIRFETAAAKAEPSPDSKVKRAQHETSTSRPEQPTAEIRPDANTIPQYLSDPDHYWTFSVYNTGYGHFQAVSHGPWKPRAATQIAGVAKNAGSQMTIARLHKVQVQPSIGGARFRFIARPDADPTIDLGSQPPVTGRDGLKVLANAITMRAERDVFGGSDVLGGSNAAVNWYAAETQAQRIKLGQNTEYHYIITVPGNDAVPIQQHAGRFTTLQSVLKVTFKSIRVIDDSDDLSDGEGTFTFCVSSGTRDVEQHSDFSAFGTDTDLHINRVLVFDKWEDGPVTIEVEGIDDEDSIIGAGRLLRGGCTLQRPMSSGTADQNIARVNFDTRSPHLRGRRGATGFRMESMAGGALAFNVLVEVEILRPST